MEEILKLIDEIEIKIPKDSAIKLKMQLLKSLTIASDDVAKLIKRGNLKGVETRIKKLQDEQMEIRTNFTIGLFPSGGLNQNK